MGIIAEHDADRDRKRREIHRAWEEGVFKKVEHQLSRYRHAAGQTPLETPRAELLPTDYPSMRPILDHQAEQRFHRYANAILQPSSPRKNLSEETQIRKAVAGLEASRGQTRPTLPVEQ